MVEPTALSTPSAEAGRNEGILPRRQRSVSRRYRLPRASRPSIRDVAREAGVAIATVSRVLSGNATVAVELRERVLAAADKLKYQPDFMAQGLRKGRSHAIGLVTDDLSNPMTAMIASGAESILRDAGLNFVDLPLYRPERGPRSGLMDVRNEKAREAGLTLTDTATTAHDTRAWSRTRDIPPALPPEREAELIRLAHKAAV